MDEIKIPKPINEIGSKKWFWVGLLIAVFNPIFSGLILGSFYLTEPSLKKYGWIILAVAIIWGAVSLLLFQMFDFGQFVK
jgi:hypothetical protein